MWDIHTEECLFGRGSEDAMNAFIFFHGNKSTYIIFIVWARWDLDVDPKGQESFYFSEIS